MIIIILIFVFFLALKGVFLCMYAYSAAIDITTIILRAKGESFGMVTRQDHVMSC